MSKRLENAEIVIKSLIEEKLYLARDVNLFSKPDWVPALADDIYNELTTRLAWALQEIVQSYNPTPGA